MGRPMAERLIDAGNKLKVWNRTPAAAEPLVRKGAALVAQPTALADCEIVVTMLADDNAVKSVWIDSGLASKLPQNAIHLNMATVSMEMSRVLKKNQKAAYVAGPVFGRPAVAAQGQLDIIAAGPKAAIERCQPLFKAMGKQVFVVGEEPEKANAVKIARNFLLATTIESLGEAFALARKCGVEAAAFHDILSNTSLGSPLVKNYGNGIVKQAWEPPQFSMMLALKDIELTLDAAREAGAFMPSADMIRKNMKEAIAAGGANHDAVGLAGYIAKKAGL